MKSSPTVFHCVVFDIEGILIRESIWPKINAVAGISADVDYQWLQDYHLGNISFVEWIRRLSTSHRQSGKIRSVYDMIIRRAIHFEPEGEQFVAALRKKYVVCLASSTVDTFVQAVADRLSIVDYHANYSFVFDEENKIVDIKYKDVEAKAKALFLKSLCKKYKFRPEQIVFVGDSINDKEAFLYTKHGILVGKGNEELVAASWKQVDKLSDILGILV